MMMHSDTYLEGEFNRVLVILSSVLLVVAEPYLTAVARKWRPPQFENEGELRSVCND